MTDHTQELILLRKDLDATKVQLVKMMNLLQEIEAPLDRLVRDIKLYNGSDKNVKD